MVSLPGGCVSALLRRQDLHFDTGQIASPAEAQNRLAFFKVENDGFDLGAQRRAIDKNDLPQARCKRSWANILDGLRAGEVGGRLSSPCWGLVVRESDKIAGSGEYNLSGERYREGTVQSKYFPMQNGGIDGGDNQATV